MTTSPPSTTHAIEEPALVAPQGKHKKRLKKFDSALEMAQYVKDKCPSLPCAKNLDVQSAGGVAKFSAAAAKCVEQCD